MHMQLFIDAAHVKRNRVDADAQFDRSGLVVVTVTSSLKRRTSCGVRLWSLEIAGWVLRSRVITRAAISGDIGIPPVAASRMPSIRRAASVFFNR